MHRLSGTVLGSTDRTERALDKGGGIMIRNAIKINKPFQNVMSRLEWCGKLHPLKVSRSVVNWVVTRYLCGGNVWMEAEVWRTGL